VLFGVEGGHSRSMHCFKGERSSSGSEDPGTDVEELGTGLEDPRTELEDLEMGWDDLKGAIERLERERK